MSNTNTSTSTAKKPVFRKILPGGISAAVFENTRDGRTYRSVNLQRSYKQNGNWNRMSMYLDHQHIPFIIEVLQGTWQFLNEHPIGSQQAHAVETDSGENLEQAAEPDAVVEQALESEFDA